MVAMKTYELYINPYPNVSFRPSRLKSEARHVGLAWLIQANDRNDAIDHFINHCRGKVKEYINKYRDDNRRIIIEEK